LASNAVRVLQRSCVEEFRQTLLDYAGEAEFDAEVVRRLSDEFTGLRPDCLEQGWDPEFPEEPQVCEESGDLPGAIYFKYNRRAHSQFVAPTQWIVDTSRATGAGEVTSVRINVHLNRVPLSSDLPKSMNYSEGDLVGGCWAYRGSIHPDGYSIGRWYRSFFKYRLRGESVIRNRVSSSNGRVGISSPTSQPECDAPLQDLLSEELDAGAVPDAASMAALIVSMLG